MSNYKYYKQNFQIYSRSTNPVTMTDAATTFYDFTTAASQAFGNNMKLVDSSPNRFAIYSGDINKDNIINLGDILDISNDVSAFVTGYNVSDLTGNGITDLNDLIIAFNNSNAFVSVEKP